MILMDRRDAILCFSGYEGRFASLDLHTGDTKYCVSTKFPDVQIPLVKSNYHF